MQGISGHLPIPPEPGSWLHPRLTRVLLHVEFCCPLLTVAASCVWGVLLLDHGSQWRGARPTTNMGFRRSQLIVSFPIVESRTTEFWLLTSPNFISGSGYYCYRRSSSNWIQELFPPHAELVLQVPGQNSCQTLCSWLNTSWAYYTCPTNAQSESTVTIAIWR